MRIGAWEALPVVDGWGREPGRDVLVRDGAAGDPWAPHENQLDDGGWLPLTLGAYLLRGHGRTILVDAGAGRMGNGRYVSGAFPARLRGHGVDPEAVTDVLLTHLHFDHIGWVSQDGVAVFPAARHHVAEADWTYFVEDPMARPSGVRKLRPVERLRCPTEDGAEIAPGVRVHHTPGHTPGHSVVEVSGGGERLWLLGDLAHCAFELEEPGWRFVYDTDPERAARVRGALVERLAGSGDLIAGAHFPDLRPGTLDREGEGVRWRSLEGDDPWSSGAPRD